MPRGEATTRQDGKAGVVARNPVQSRRLGAEGGAWTHSICTRGHAAGKVVPTRIRRRGAAYAANPLAKGARRAHRSTVLQSQQVTIVVPHPPYVLSAIVAVEDHDHLPDNTAGSFDGIDASDD